MSVQDISNDVVSLCAIVLKYVHPKPVGFLVSRVIKVVAKKLASQEASRHRRFISGCECEVAVRLLTPVLEP